MGRADLAAECAMTRFFVRPDQIAGSVATLDEPDAYHLRVVLKSAIGEKVTILDGTGREFPGRLAEIGKTRATVQIAEPAMANTEPHTAITVAQALPKMAEKMEQVLQHGTEIGATGFWAYASERSLTHLSGERHSKRTSRWQSIIKTAAEQSHRAKLPTLQVDGTLADILSSIPLFDLTLVAHTESAIPLRDALGVSQPKNVLVIIGPESGFAAREVADAGRSGAKIVSLGPRILRTETAALTMVSQLLYALEPIHVR